jgi:hypothetical protein
LILRRRKKFSLADVSGNWDTVRFVVENKMDELSKILMLNIYNQKCDGV